MASTTVPRPSTLSRSSNSLQCLSQQSRSLSASAYRRAPSGRFPSVDLMKKVPSQASMSARMNKAKRSDIPNDIGLIPMTFIRPRWKDMPSLFSSRFKERLVMEWVYLRQSFTDLASKYYVYRWGGQKHPVTGRRDKWPLWFKERASVARDLHQKLYSAIAGADRRTINEIACMGLAQQQIARLDRRRAADLPAEIWQVKYRGIVPSAKMLWTLQCLIPPQFKAVNVIADRQINLPVGQKTTLRQFIVRIDSRQTREKNDGSDSITADLSEYLVVQRFIIDEKPEEWRVWGTTKPSAYADAQEILNASKAEGRESIMDRARAMMGGTFMS